MKLYYMKNVSIKYNPYLLKTEIKIDGEVPKSNSSLHFGKQRLQEWAEKFVAIFGMNIVMRM